MRVLSLDVHSGLDDVAPNSWSGYSIPTSGWILAMGFQSIGCEVDRINPRNKAQLARLPVVIQANKPDLCVANANVVAWKNAPKGVPISVLQKLRKKNIPVVIRYGDAYQQINSRTKIACEGGDFFVQSSAGHHLKRYRGIGNIKTAAFLPMPAPLLSILYAGLFDRTIPWFFSGVISKVGDGYRRQDLDLLRSTAQKVNCAFVGVDRKPVSGMAHWRLLHRSKRALAVNAWHDFSQYMSSRTINYMAVGADVAIRWVPNLRPILPPDIQMYKNHHQLRKIALEPRNEERASNAGIFVQEHYGAKVCAKYILDIVFGNIKMRKPIWEEVYE